MCRRRHRHGLRREGCAAGCQRGEQPQQLPGAHQVASDADAQTKERTAMRDYPMFWVLLEIGLGLGLFVFIIWWTLPKKDQRKDDGKDR